MPHFLDGAREKVKRAQKHIQTLHRNVATFKKKRPYAARIEKDGNAREVRIFAKANGKTEPPIDFILLAGEIAHQLRSALDHAVFALYCRRHGREPKHKTQFPIFETRTGYITRGHRMIQGIPRAAFTYIYRVQPFKEGTTPREHPLWMLQDLNNTEKHRLIPIIATGIAELNFLSTDFIEEHSILWGRDVMPLQDGAKLWTVPWDTNLEVHMNPQIACEIAFEKIGDAKLQAIIPTLKQLSNAVDSIIFDLKYLFP